MNATIILLLAPLTMWMFVVQPPPGTSAVVSASLPPVCNFTGVAEVYSRMAIACVNTGVEPLLLSGWVDVQWRTPQPPPAQLPPSAPILALAVGAAAAAGLSHLFSNRRELLLAPIAPVLARVKTARAEDPVRREIVRAVEKMGAATLSQIARATGRSWSSVQWHLYVLEREGRVKSVRIGPFTYYYVNPKAAAEVILASVNPDTLSPEDREKLDLMASA